MSTFEDDPEMTELIDQFAGSLPDRVRLIEAAHASGDFELLSTLAHQLKGAGGGYGFAPITTAGQDVESAIASHAEAAALAASVARLTEVCGAVRSPRMRARMEVAPEPIPTRGRVA